MKMNQEIKKLWVNALRSGDYTQGKYYLNQNNQRFCCLGVLCELAVKAKIITKSEIPQGDEEVFAYGDNSYDDRAETMILPNKVKSWAELNDCNGNAVIIWEILFKSKHNDAGKTFLEIADAIETQL